MKINKTSGKRQRHFTTIVLLLATIILCSHDLYLKMESYFLKPNQNATLNLYNGTFEKSENIITRDRMLDASIAAHGERNPIPPKQWTDQDSTITKLNFTVGKAGTYVAGVSTKPRNIELTADKFNSYLKHDGVLDMLEQRKHDSLLDQDAVESYEKYVKAIYQVGDVKTEDWNTILGYPIEFIPESNPYDLYKGDKMDVKLLLDGNPLSNQLVYADYINTSHHHSNHSHGHEHAGEEHSHEHKHNDEKQDHGHGTEDHSHDHEGDNNDAEHSHTSGQQLRTNDEGIVSVSLAEEGIYYLRTIHMVNVIDSDELTHRSKWATLTFEVTHRHGADTHTHDHHDHEGEIPTWAFVLGSLLIIGILFFAFRKKD